MFFFRQVKTTFFFKHQTFYTDKENLGEAELLQVVD